MKRHGIRLKASIAIAGLAIGALLMVPPAAHAVSLPYIDDVNEWGAAKSIATIVCTGDEHGYRLRVTDCKTGKRIKAEHVKKRVWLAVLKHKRTYKLQVRGIRGNGSKTAWQTIRYRIG